MEPTPSNEDTIDVLHKKPEPVGDSNPKLEQPPMVSPPPFVEQPPQVMPQYFTELVRSSVFLLIDKDRLLYYYLLNDIQRIIGTFLLPPEDSQKIANRKSAKFLTEI